MIFDVQKLAMWNMNMMDITINQHSTPPHYATKKHIIHAGAQKMNYVPLLEEQ